MCLGLFGPCFWPEFAHAFGLCFWLHLVVFVARFGPWYLAWFFPWFWPNLARICGLFGSWFWADLAEDQVVWAFWGDFFPFRFYCQTPIQINGLEMTPCFCFRRSSFRDQSLRRLVPGLLRLQLGSKAPSIVCMYKSGWLRWRKWASSKNSTPVNPAKPLYIALFINELTKICVENNMGVSPIEPTLYGIRWGHTMAGWNLASLVVHSWNHLSKQQKGSSLVQCSQKSLCSQIGPQ